MKSSRLLLLAFITFVFCTWITIISAYCQTTDEEVETELLEPDFASAQYGFGIAIPEGYITFEIDDIDAWFLNIVGEIDAPSSIITVEELPDDIIDTAAYWQLLKERDPLMARNITYEMSSAVAGTGAILSRVEMIEANTYIMALTWVFVHDGSGFSIACYPPSSGDYTVARDFAQEIVQQFRWMTEEEIAELEPGDDEEIVFPGGQDF